MWTQSNAKSFFIDTNAAYSDSAEPLDQRAKAILKPVLNYIDKTQTIISISLDKKRLLYRVLLAGVLSVELFGNMNYSLIGYNLKQYLMLKFPDLLIQAEYFLKATSGCPNEAQKRSGLSLHLAIAWKIILPFQTYNPSL